MGEKDMNPLPVAILLVMGTAWPAVAMPSRPAAAVAARDRAPQGWDIEIAPANSRREHLVLSGRVLGMDDSLPLPGAQVYVYHADEHGDYARRGKEALGPRFAGVLRTSDRGEYRVRTVMPGSYSHAPPHVHFEVWGEGLARRALWVNIFTSSHEAAAHTLQRFPAGPAPPMGGDVVAIRESTGVLHCTWDLHLSRGVVMP